MVQPQKTKSLMQMKLDRAKGILEGLTLENYDHAYAGNPLKQWLVYLRSYYPQAALLFERIKRLRDPLELGAALAEPDSLQARVA